MSISKEFKVGLVALIGLVLLYFGVRFLKGMEVLSSSKNYYVVYEHINGLKVSNPVILNGYPIGRVKAITFLPERGYSMLVSLEIASEIKIGDRTKAILTDPALLGDKAIKLEIVSQNGYLQPGDTLISLVDEGISGLLQEKALPILETIDSTGNSLNILLKEYHGMGESVKLTVENTAMLAATMDSKIKQLDMKQLNRTMSNLALVSDSLVMATEQLRPALQNLAAISDSLKQMPLVQISEQLNATATNLNEVLVLLKEKEGTMGMMMNDKELYIQLTQTVANLDSLLVDLKENPKRYVKFSMF